MTDISAETFDYIIVGGGTAGCVLANRLTASGQHSVLLLEAGREARSPWVPIPAGFSRLLTNPTYNWRFQTEPEEATGNRVIAVPRGKGLGGSTLINGMIYVRGQPQDYDGWAQRGCLGWSFEDVLPYFKRLEDFDGATGTLRARGGPLPLVEVSERPAIAEAFIAAAGQAGFPRNPDYNADHQDGFGYYQVNQRHGRRVSAAEAYLRPARGRANLAVRTDAHVLHVVLEGSRAVGVTARVGTQTLRFAARAEVILAAGAAQTPQLLELSGIGDPAILKALDIPVAAALPGVGANYIDHFCTRMNWRVKQPVTLNEQTRGVKLGLSVLQYFATRRGILTLGTGLAFGFVRTRPELVGPDVQYFFMHASYANAAERKLDHLPGMTIGVTQLRPESRGTIHAVSPDPMRAPAIRPNFLAAAEDCRAMVEGMKIARHIVDQAAMDPYRQVEMAPGPDCRTDADWLAFARRDGQTIYHICGTCRMGLDSLSVTDPELRVHGVAGLRVVDASIMPTIVSGNTQAAVFMIAEKAADMILAAAKQSAQPMRSAVG
ncbi:GMC family oxidoreductase [Chelatococcus asaccharovorans]|uniref:Choline dehydrogenase-like flavoprotein n=1 Tax=Chelatococcus asaccharovorans TaxID=28210 RepID=A0A2V3UET8_9HYPH|nr:GMC family oxidoreductase N-terminal domain-containing protein [Chelatococcus asaccharovorans]MBS7707071.1 GMC family oxidoreductase N-terminal domain-containing protein [Chelatococcus asaccharovorans]PXW63251.1 choline dehydrogenase-like flavoprotein [Chelatococcus asaccharovorans]